MRKVITFLLASVIAAYFATSAAFAGADSPVQYTYTLTDLEQGAGGGGPLFADGSAGGHQVIVARNGQVIAHLSVASWSEIVPGESLDICFTVNQTKGPPIFPPYFCTSWLGIVLPVSGTPVVITNPQGGSYLLLRVSPAG